MNITLKNRNLTQGIKTILLLLSLFLATCPELLAKSFHLQNIDSRDGLSNSAVLSLYQDNNEFLWVGTYNGLNRYDGKFIKAYSLDECNDSVQSSNIIENIHGADDNCLWLSTYIGLNKFSIDEQKVVEYYPNYRFPYNLTSNNENLTCLIARKGFISVYDKFNKTFIDLPSPEIDPAGVIASFFDNNNNLWICSNTNKVYKIKIVLSDSSTTISPTLQVSEVALSASNIVSAFEENGFIIYLGDSGNLYTYDIHRERNNYIRNISELVSKYGSISSIITYLDDFIISFKSNGVLKLIANQKYKEEYLDMNSGVFCLLKDQQQEIVWIGFDGQGLGTYSNKSPIFNTINSSALPIPISKPIRSIYTDEENTLWVGTKGDGLIKIEDFDNVNKKKIPSDKVSYYTTKNGLSNNQVFAIIKSRYHNINWLATDGPGLSYFSLKDNKIFTLSNPTSTPIKRVHTVVEENDSTLWLATAGHGLLKVSIEKKENSISAKKIQIFLFSRNKKIVNDLFAMYMDDKGYLWIGSRGDGVIHFKMEDESYSFITSGKKFNSSTDDILTYCRSKSSHFYFGSCAGLLKLSKEDSIPKLVEIPNKLRTGMKEMIHGMQEDETGCIWMGTNRGIGKYNPFNNMFHKYMKHTGLNVIEFSDNADYSCPHTKRIFFGGIDGIVWIEPRIPDNNSISSPIKFTGLKLNGQDQNIKEYILKGKGEDFLQLSAKENNISVSFVAIDYIYGMDIQYSYSLENYNNEWVNANEQNEAQFISLPPGHYTLKVKYRNDVFDTESQFYTMQIIVLQPWYLNNTAKTIYSIIIFLLIIFSIHLFSRKSIQRQKDFSRSVIEKNKEELYEAKMKFFTNITHEFLTPLTLMQGPCERIMTYKNTDAYINQYTSMLHANVEKLQSLVHEIINFSKSEELNENSIRIEQVNLNKTIKAIATAFTDSIERNKIDFKINIDDNLNWNTSTSSINKILMNLISNAFKYTPIGGKVRISFLVENQVLTIKVYNTGSGIAKNEINKVFDRYSILNNMEKNVYMDYSSRNGLGLAICYSMIQQLQGSVEVKSEKNKYAEFIVRIPTLPLSNILKETSEAPLTTTKPESLAKPQNNSVLNQNKARILVVDDNKDIVWMISESLETKYEIIKAFNTQQALSILENTLPELIIADLIMPGEMDGMDLVKKLKSDPFTRHIPIVIISAKVSIDDQMLGVEFGADMYLTKPFNLGYLKSIIEQLIRKEDVLREYYNSPISAIELNEGRLIHQKDQDFIVQVTDVLDKNIELGDLRPEQVAEMLKLNPQAFYRKLKAITFLSPRGFIKKYRFSVAAKLLISTNLSVQEIIYRVGINNRSYFYREFSKIYDSTPKDFRELNNDEINKKKEALLNHS